MRGTSQGRRRFARRGEVAVFDIVLFIPLLLVGLLLLDGIVTTPVAGVTENVNSSRYAAEGTATTLGSTVSTTWYFFYGPCNPNPFSGNPCFFYCPNPAQGCWIPQHVNDQPVSALVLLDIELVSCHAVALGGYTITQAQLDTPGFMGSAIQETAQSVAEGAGPGAPYPVTYSSYYFDFNGTAVRGGGGFGGTPCPGPITPERIHDGNYPNAPTGEVYTWSTVLPPNGGNEGPVMVVMAFWGP